MANPPRKRLVTKNVEDTISSATDVVEDDPMIDAVIPKAFKLTLDNGSEVHYNAGLQRMPLEHFSHWFSKVNGVVEAQPAQSPPQTDGTFADTTIDQPPT